MASSNQIQNALLTEHFRYTPLTLLDDIINTVNELVFRAINAIEEGLSTIPPEALGFKLPPTTTSTSVPTTTTIAAPTKRYNPFASPSPTPAPGPSNNAEDEETHRQDALYELKQTEIGTGIHQLESLLNATVDRDFDKFEIYTLRNILAVGHEEEADLANWIQLEHYRHLDLSAGGVVDGVRPEDVLMQRRKLVETRKLNAMLKSEEARNAAVLEQLGALVGSGKNEGEASPFGFLTAENSTATGTRPLGQNVQYAVTQLPALREMLGQLKESLHTLPNARHTPLSDESKEAKRRDYLDTQSRRAMVRRGIEVTDGTAQATAAASTGRRIGREEVEGMEAVVQALGGARQRDERMEG